jgi:sodium/proline symporter
MGVIIFVPFFVLNSVGGWTGVREAMTLKHLSTTLIPDFSTKTLLEILGMVAGWGLGYFGQPHIVTKFMGIRNVHEIKKSKWIGMSWMVLSLGAATLVGLIGIAFFKEGLSNTELVFVNIVKNSFSPFFIGLILCAVLAATINAMSSQVLVLSSSLTEDFYKRIFRKNASSKELLIVARGGVVVASLVAFLIAYGNITSIYSLVLYAWSGLGSAFGPLLLLSLYWKKVTKQGAWAGILSGGIVAGIWPYFDKAESLHIPSMIPGFFTSLILIVLLSLLSQPSVQEKK